MTDAQSAIATRIYNQCLAGTSSDNPGLPEVLAEFVVGQSYNETGGWTSHFYVEGNACFGYECDSSSDYQKGCSTSTSDNNATVGYYASVEDSTKELIDWIYRRIDDGKFPSDLTTITSADMYAGLLSKAGYFTSGAAAYAARIMQFLTNAGNLFRKR